MLDDCFKDVKYDLDEDSFAISEEDDLFRKRFIRSWESLVDGYKVCLTQEHLGPALTAA